MSACIPLPPPAPPIPPPGVPNVSNSGDVKFQVVENLKKLKPTTGELPESLLQGRKLVDRLVLIGHLQYSTNLY